MIEILYSILNNFQEFFTKPSFEYFIQFIIGYIAIKGNKYVTNIFLNSSLKKHFTNYYRFLKQYKWSLEEVINKVIELIIKLVMGSSKRIYLIIDDTKVKKSGNKIYGISRFFNYGNKRNEPKYIYGNCFVSIGIALENIWKEIIFFPVRCLLFISKKYCSEEKFRSKIEIASKLIGDVKLSNLFNIVVLGDSFYSVRDVVYACLRRGYNYIGRLANNSAFYNMPKRVKEKRRGRKRKYGSRIDVRKLKGRKYISIKLYGKKREISYATKIVKVRWLKVLVKLVVVYEVDKKPMLFFSTDTNMSGIEILKSYEKRWKIEVVFRDLKNRFGLRDYRVRDEVGMEKQVNLIYVAYTILGLVYNECRKRGLKIEGNLNKRPWYKKDTVSINTIRDYFYEEFLLNRIYEFIGNAYLNSKIQKNIEQFAFLRC